MPHQLSDGQVIGSAFKHTLSEAVADIIKSEFFTMLPGKFINRSLIDTTVILL